MANTLRTETRRLLCKLSEEEISGLSTELAQTFQDVQAEEDRQSAVKAEMKAKLTRFKERMQELATSIVGKAMARDTEVEVTLSGFTVMEVRMDTGEVVFSRPATPQELQTSFPAET